MICGKRWVSNRIFKCYGFVYFLFIYGLNFRLWVINRLWCNVIDFFVLEVELNVYYFGVGYYEGSLKSFEGEEVKIIKGF